MGKSGSVDAVAVRHLDQIQEQEPGPQSSRLVGLVMASFGGACIVFAALALMRSPASDKPAVSDPLGDLVAASKNAPPPKSRDGLRPADVTFPAVLTDQSHPTTAMEAVRRRPRSAPEELEELPRAGDPLGPPPATDRLAVVPLPAQEVISSLPKGKVAKGDTLYALARKVGSDDAATTLAEPGHAGGYQLQVSSFKKQEDADGFALALRRRGHRAYVQRAHVKGRGLWFRVRIGPFKYKRSARIYRQDFEAKERVVGFVVDPPKTRIHIVPADGE